MSQGEIVLVSGCPGSGKTSLTRGFPNHIRLNRDLTGGKLADLVPILEQKIGQGGRHFVLDNTFPDAKSRRPFIEAGARHGIPVRIQHLATDAEQASVNIATRMIERYGKLLSPPEIAETSKKDPNIFPPVVLYVYFKRFEQPTTAEGFSKVEVIPFVREYDPSFTGLGLGLDYDLTIRRTISGRPCPFDPDDIEILDNRLEVIKRYKRKKYRPFGCSNQGDVGRGRLPIERAIECFDRTNELLGLKLEYGFCPHPANPVQCWCRKPMPGLPLLFVHKRKLDVRRSIFVGDMKTDEQVAKRLGMQWYHPKDFFKK